MPDIERSRIKLKTTADLIPLTTSISVLTLKPRSCLWCPLISSSHSYPSHRVPSIFLFAYCHLCIFFGVMSVRVFGLFSIRLCSCWV